MPSARGLGRIGTLPEPEPLHAFADRVAAALPPTTWGVRPRATPTGRSAGSRCAGCGDSALGAAAAAGVDAYVTADLRHHPASESLLRRAGRRWSTSHTGPRSGPGARQAADVLRAELGGSVEVRVSTRRTDPWTVGRAQPIGRKPQ